MSDEKKILPENNAAPENPQNAEEYAAAMKSVRENTVSKEEYEKSENERKILIRALAEGTSLTEAAPEEKPADIKELRNKFLNAGELNLNNAEYIKTALELRKALMDAGEPDPFLPAGAKISPTLTDIQGAQKSADAFQSWLDASTDENGKIDPELFNAYMKKGISDDSPLITARLRANKSRKA